MKKVFFIFSLFGAVICLLSCEQKEDLTKAYRKQFTGKYQIASIRESIRGLALDLNGDGTKSVNLLDEYKSLGAIEDSRFSFLPNKDGGYDGSFALFCPIQYIFEDLSAQPPYSIDTPITFDNTLLYTYTVSFPMTLSADGTATWQKALQDSADQNKALYIQLLHNGEILKAEGGIIDLVIHEVPVYDCTQQKLVLHSLEYHLVHE